jgi:CRP/FNR family cyclic AMP-dependent transcriptional regulator
MIQTAPATLLTPTVRSAVASSPLDLDKATLARFLDHCHRRKYPNRTDVFRPGDAATTLYYLVSGSLSVISEESEDRELVLSYANPGDFVGEMGLFVKADKRVVTLRTRSPVEVAEISYERLHQLLTGPLSADAPKLLYVIGAQLSKRLLETSRKASRLAFLDVGSRIVRALHDLCQEPDAMSHPQGTQIRVSRQELARIVGCSREMAGRVLKQLQEQGLLHARGKTIVVYGTR